MLKMIKSRKEQVLFVVVWIDSMMLSLGGTASRFFLLFFYLIVSFSVAFPSSAFT